MDRAFMEDPSAYSQMGFEERLSLLVDAEWNCRQNNKLLRCIREARFAAPGAVIEDIEYHADRHLDKAQILRFASCKFIEENHHIIFKGASGSGKTFLACALGNAACQKLKSVRYIRLPELLEELSLAQAAGELKKTIKTYQKYDLLILDEWLIRCLTPQESYSLLEVIEARCNEADSARIGAIVAINTNTSTMHNNLLIVMFMVPPFGFYLTARRKSWIFPVWSFIFNPKLSDNIVGSRSIA